MKKYFDRLKKGRRVKVLGKNETPVKNATVQFKMEYSEKMYDEPMYWCHIESTEKKYNRNKGKPTTVSSISFIEGRAYFITKLQYK
jgi:hypothetical protein